MDQDGDGVLSLQDCDDSDPSAYPGAIDACYDNIDSDCMGGSDWDCDGDGQISFREFIWAFQSWISLDGEAAEVETTEGNDDSTK